MRLLVLVADAYLVGVAVTVALVIYPSFYLVGLGQWSEFHQAHQRRMMIAVGPAWVLQGVGAFWWLLDGHERTGAVLHALIALGAVLLTFFSAVALHRQLGVHYDENDIRRLQRVHLIRCAAWVTCALLALTMS